jgi:hypothetical protein
MGNGLLIFPIILSISLISNRILINSAFIFTSWIVVWALYFYNYNSPTASNSFYFIINNLPQYIGFFFAFLGNPFGSLFSNEYIAIIFGFLSFSVAILILFNVFVNKELTEYKYFLFGVYGFILLSALAAMSGRASFGIGAALPSRYAIGPLLSYIILSLLLIDCIKSHARRNAYLFFGFALLCFISVFQFKITPDFNFLYSQKLAILAHKVNLDRPKLDSLLFPESAHEHFSTLAEYAEDNRLGIYGDDWLKYAGELKFSPGNRNDSLCMGVVDGLGSDEIGQTLNGWAISRVKGNSGNLLIVIINGDNNIIGYGISGSRRIDVHDSIHDAPIDSGWYAFSTTDINADAYVFILGKFCKLRK